jgi:site-specific DNA-methyltransferase (adenine-specific)
MAAGSEGEGVSYLLIHGDARKLPINPKSIDAIVSDPPYGMGWNTDSRRFTGGHQKQGYGLDWGAIEGDSVPFNPTPWLSFPKVILFGMNHFSARLPVGTTLVWVKKREGLWGTFLSDAELAWMKGGHGVYLRFCEGSSVSRMAEAAGSLCHPTQKPIRLMRWCIRKLKLPPNSLILDPYMGSGTTGIAALQEGHHFIGIDIERKYVEIARRRLERPHQVVGRPGKPEHHPLFGDPA